MLMSGVSRGFGNRPLVVHALRGGLTVMLMPALAEWLAPVSPVTIGVTVVMIMSIPTTARRVGFSTSKLIPDGGSISIGWL